MRHLAALCLLLSLSVACGDDPKPPQTIIVIVEDEPDQPADQGAPDLATDLPDTPDMDTPDAMPSDMSDDMSLDMTPDMETDMSVDMEPDMAPDMEVDMAPDPCANFQNPVLIKPNCGPAPLSVRFDASGVLNGFDDVRDYYWELSDGSIVREVAFDATYQTPGEFTELFHFVVIVSGNRVEGSIDAKARVLP